MYIYIYIGVYIHGGFPDSIIIRKWLRSGKLKKTYPTVRTNIGVQRKQTYPLACELRRGMLKGMLTPCVRIASDNPCFRVCLPPLARSGFKGYALGYALGMLWVCFLASTQLYRLGKGIVWVRGVNSSSSSSSSSDSDSSSSSSPTPSSRQTLPQTPKQAPEAYPLSIPRSAPSKHTQ